MADERTWKVVRILDEYHIVINAGVGEVKDNDTVEVFALGVEIVDPETKEILGNVTYPKARLRIIQVDTRLSVAKTIETEVVEGTSWPGLSMTLMEALGTRRTILKKLPVRPEEVEGGWPQQSERTIKIGDLVRKPKGG